MSCFGGRKEGREGGRREVEGKEGGKQEGRKERQGEGGREGFYFLCAQEAGDMMEEGHGDRVLHHNGTCTRCNAQRGCPFLHSVIIFLTGSYCTGLP